MCSGCGTSSRANPSSVTQLPILTALHARYPTLFLTIIHETYRKVNPYFHNFHAAAKDHNSRKDVYNFLVAKNEGGDSTNLVILMKKL